MSLFEGLSTPKWMSPTDLDLAATQSGEPAGRIFSEAFNNAARMKQQKDEFTQLLPLRISANDAENAQRAASTVSQVLTNQEKATWLNNSTEDRGRVSQWYQDTGNDISKILSTPAPQLQTPEAQMVVANARKAAAMTSFGMAQTERQTQLISRAAQLTASGFNIPYDQKTGFPDENAIAVAGQQLAARQTQAKISTINATTEGKKEVAQINADSRVQAAQIRSEALSNNVEPQEKTLSDGSKVVFNPKGGGFKLLTTDGKDKSMSNSELLSLYKTLPDDDSMKTNLLSTIKQRIPKSQQPYGIARLPTPANAPASKDQAPPVPADLSQREKGKVYQSPKGLFKWNGNGWEPAQ